MPPQFQDFITVFLAIVIEALPFVVLGVFVASILHSTIQIHLLFERLSRMPIIGRLVTSCFGFLMPVCECGNVPVARSMLLRGVKLDHVLVFLLAAPVFNPIVYLTTKEAFRNFPDMVWLRLGIGLLMANIIGYVLRKAPTKDTLSENIRADIAACRVQKKPDTFSDQILFFQKEFLQMMRTLIFGAAIAALIQTFVPREIIVSLTSNPYLAILLMILLAFVVSICSNVDAFFALSFVGVIPVGGLIAFLVFGPMMDIKMFSLLRSTFQTKFLIKLTLLIALLSFIAGAIVQWVYVK